MVDFRYHALSLIAVLVALAVGLLLGVAIGDQGLVSSAEDALRDDVEERVQEARAEAADLRDELALRNSYEERTLSTLVGDRLDGRRIAVLFIHEQGRAAFEPVRDAVQAAGGRLASVSSLREPFDLAELGAAAAGSRFDDLVADSELARDLAERVGSQVVGGGRLIRSVREELLSSVSGSLGGAEGVVLVRGEPPADPADRVPEEFVTAFVEGLRSFSTPVVGVELTSTDPSQIGWYEERGIASVDNVDEPSGKASLVFALAGAADGAYGRKATADSLVPTALVGG